MTQGAKRFMDLRAWQACDVYKKAVLKLCASGPLSRDFELRDQLQRSVCAPTDHVSEGFGRFSPPDFARFVVMARSSLMESQNQLMTAVDKGHITEAARAEHNALAEVALEETTGLVEYLQSAEALRNAKRIRDRRDARRAARNAERNRNGEPNPNPNAEPNRNEEPNPNPNQNPNQNPNTEPNRNTNREQRTKNKER